MAVEGIKYKYESEESTIVCSRYYQPLTFNVPLDVGQRTWYDLKD